MPEFLYVLRLIPRLRDAAAWTAEDEAAVARHFALLKEREATGVVRMAGRTQEAEASTFGLCLLEAADEEAARGLMESDPAVSGGVMTAELHPFKTAVGAYRSAAAGPGFFDTVRARASVRSFSPRPIRPEEWESLLRAAMAAPSAVNRQPWSFVVVERRESLAALAEALPYAKMTAQAGGAVIVAADPAEAHLGSAELALLDAAAACENLLLAAQALGLGAVWTALWPYEERMAPVRRLLGIPEGVIPLALVPVGEPSGPVQPKDKFRPEKIHRESW